ncbi:MAG: DUF2178 domain-containing protein [Methanomicrobium sp.]|nr:DUF2178 domain-containing protein [Methanomicrobium sp.]MBQ4414745.1 DUF2178 domain-containing protein [Methanomicrobium sp.]
MKKNTYYIITSIIVFIVALINYGAICLNRYPAMLIVTASVLIAAITLFILRSRIEDPAVTDELISKINEMSATRSLQITWILVFAAVVANLSIVWYMDDPVLRSALLHLGMPFLINLAIMIMVYAIFRIYYTHKYMGLDDDEESD